MALVALFHLPDSQIWMQPVEFVRLQVLQQETVASCVFDVRPQSTTDQNRTNNGLKDTESDCYYSKERFQEFFLIISFSYPYIFRYLLVIFWLIFAY